MFRSAIALCLLSTVAQADINVTFTEGAPKDRFTITNSQNCALDAVTVSIDLGTSASGLIFDVTGAGAGVEVFQPLELVSGADHVQAMSAVKDGDTLVTFTLTNLGTTPVAFTVDIDDTAGQREITVSGSEIQGAEVVVDLAGAQTKAAFGRNAMARVPVAGCTS